METDTDSDEQKQSSTSVPLLPQQVKSQDNPPPYSPPAAGPTAYCVPSSDTGYGNGYGVPPSQQQQHQVTFAAPVQYVYVQSQQWFITGAIVYSCVVFFLCCWPLGIAAFILASEYIVIIGNRMSVFSVFLLMFVTHCIQGVRPHIVKKIVNGVSLLFPWSIRILKPKLLQ